jgi:crotonobetainyl-CoA:carnitine CoA-transferase CaiB-like acyl-CoA transferase
MSIMSAGTRCWSRAAGPDLSRCPLSDGPGRVRTSERVFDGLKVIDCASFIAGPAAATVMSDFGAAVIKIEPPGAGDPHRRRATPPVGPGLAGNPGFVLDGRNKRSLTLDLRQAEGQAVLRWLAESSHEP